MSHLDCRCNPGCQPAPEMPGWEAKTGADGPLVPRRKYQSRHKKGEPMGSPGEAIGQLSGLVRMVVHLGLMGWMFVLMESMLAGVVMIMHVHILGVAVLMGMFVDMFVNMGVGVFVSVDCAPMVMLMTMGMSVLMGMQMTVLMFAEHNKILPPEKLRVFHKPIKLNVKL